MKDEKPPIPGHRIYVNGVELPPGTEVEMSVDQPVPEPHTFYPADKEEVVIPTSKKISFDFNFPGMTEELRERMRIIFGLPIGENEEPPDTPGIEWTDLQ